MILHVVKKHAGLHNTVLCWDCAGPLNRLWWYDWLAGHIDVIRLYQQAACQTGKDAYISLMFVALRTIRVASTAQLWPWGTGQSEAKDEVNERLGAGTKKNHNPFQKLEILLRFSMDCSWYYKFLFLFLVRLDGSLLIFVQCFRYSGCPWNPFSLLYMHKKCTAGQENREPGGPKDLWRLLLGGSDTRRWRWRQSRCLPEEDGGRTGWVKHNLVGTNRMRSCGLLKGQSLILTEHNWKWMLFRDDGTEWYFSWSRDHFFRRTLETSIRWWRSNPSWSSRALVLGVNSFCSCPASLGVFRKESCAEDYRKAGMNFLFPIMKLCETPKRCLDFCSYCIYTCYYYASLCFFHAFWGRPLFLGPLEDDVASAAPWGHASRGGSSGLGIVKVLRFLK